ncbi:MAG: aldo/keto reductase [Alphaproteobacteria bacterium]|nr:aldo/keto reductase [Alphaproteobacteria bacterium]
MEATLIYNRTGKSGLLLPAISLGLWQNFGGASDKATMRAICARAFELGVTHFDLANNYGPPPGSAEENFGEILRGQFAAHRDELIISTKAGYHMWDGPYGEWGGRKYMLASLDQSLKRLGLSYVDIYYSHRFDPNTPLEETMGALDHAVRSGKALYVGISNYPAAATKKAAAILKKLGTPCLIHQPRFSMLQQEPLKEGVFKAVAEAGMGAIAYSPLAQGMLTSKYLAGIPQDSRASQNFTLKRDRLTDDVVARVKALNALAEGRGQTLAQMAIAWVLTHPEITSALIGASRVAQVEDAVGALNNAAFSKAELGKINKILAG